MLVEYTRQPLNPMGITPRGAIAEMRDGNAWTF
jgi:hypothetical protein